MAGIKARVRRGERLRFVVRRYEIGRHVAPFFLIVEFSCIVSPPFFWSPFGFSSIALVWAQALILGRRWGIHAAVETLSQKTAKVMRK